MPKTLAEINDIIGPEVTQDLRQIIADAIASVRTSDAELIVDLTENVTALKAVASERDAYKVTIENFLAADEAKRAELVANAVKTAEEKRITELQIEIAEDKAELERDQAELEKLKPNN
jgi:hypothetical protein